MPSCAIIICKARSQESKGKITFHRFPKEPDVCKQWMEVTGRRNWNPTKLSTVCSQHFDDKDFDEKKSGNKYLKHGVVPHKNVVRLVNKTISSTLPPRKPQNQIYLPAVDLPKSKPELPASDIEVLMRPKLSKEERLERKRTAERLRMQRIKSDPDLYAQWQKRQREKYLKNKRMGKIVPISQLPRKQQQIMRKKSRESSNRHNRKKKMKCSTLKRKVKLFDTTNCIFLITLSWLWIPLVVKYILLAACPGFAWGTYIILSFKLDQTAHGVQI